MVVDAADRVTGHRWWRGVSAFLPELIPAWWVVRAWLAVAVLAGISSGRPFAGGGPILLPRLFGSLVLGLIVLVTAIVWSVRWGRAAQSRGPRSAGMAAGALILAGVVLVLLGLSFVVARSADSGPAYTTSDTFVEPLQPVGAQASDGSAYNVYAYRPDGTPVGPVLLYDQNGRPLVVGNYIADASERSVRVYDDSTGQEIEVVPPTDANGVPVPNLYPRQLFQIETDQSDGSLRRQPIPPPPVQVPGAVTATATTSPLPTPPAPGGSATTQPGPALPGQPATTAGSATSGPATVPPSTAVTSPGDPSATATTRP